MKQALIDGSALLDLLLLSPNVGGQLLSEVDARKAELHVDRHVRIIATRLKVVQVALNLGGNELLAR